MAPPRKKAPTGGGILFVFGAIGGALLGAFYGETTVGFLVGIGTAALISLVMWLISRRSA